MDGGRPAYTGRGEEPPLSELLDDEVLAARAAAARVSIDSLRILFDSVGRQLEQRTIQQEADQTAPDWKRPVEDASPIPPREGAGELQYDRFMRIVVRQDRA